LIHRGGNEGIELSTRAGRQRPARGFGACRTRKYLAVEEIERRTCSKKPIPTALLNHDAGSRVIDFDDETLWHFGWRKNVTL
jgi:hypothetical protein